MRSFGARVAALLVLTLGLGNCSESPTGALRAGVARLALSVAISPAARDAALSAGVADLLIDNVHVVVSHADETIAKELDVPFPTSESQIAIEVEVTLNSLQETLNVQVELRSGVLPLYTGAQEVAARRGASTSPLTVPVSYVGPSAIAVLAGDLQTALLGTALPIAPSVRVTTADGSPVPGVTVTFAVTGGGGSLTGATQTTNANGVATLGAWTLGALTAAQTLTATVGTLTATFHATSIATLTLTGLGIGTGNIVSTPAGLQCSVVNAVLKGSCTATFPASTVVTLSATPNAISNLVGWTGACSGTTSCQLTMDQARTVGVNFGLLPYTLTVLGTGVGNGVVAGSVSPAINCSILGGVAQSGCSATYPGGTSVTLSPSVVQLSGYFFGGWSGGCSGTSNCVIPGTTGNVSVTANFGFDPCLQATALGINATVQAPLANTDCQFATGQFVDYYTFTIPAPATPAQQLFTATLSSPFRPELLAFIYPGTYWFSIPDSGLTTVSQTLALPAGTYELGAVNADANAPLGTYSIALAPLSQLVGCQNTRTTFGINQLPAILAADCAYTTIAGVNTFADGFNVFVPAGKKLNVTVTTTSSPLVFQPLIEFRTTTSDKVLGEPIASSTGKGGSGSASLSITGAAGGQFVKIWVSNDLTLPVGAAFVGGPYTITIDP